MKTMKKLLCLVLVLALAASLFVFPASAEKAEASQADYPFIFLHGLMGWGEKSDLDPIVPYWGMTTGNLMKYLNGKGYESYAAQVGPFSSAWDRACELYAQLTGTTVDYGIAHSAEKDHDRYGITYDKPLFEGWSADKKINIIGHSFGGATSRLFLEILANGAPEEVAAAKAAGVEVSPFFEGGKGDWVYSLTAVSAPHNGTTFIEKCDISTAVVTDMMYDIGATLGMTNFKGVYALQLEQFGIYQKPDETDMQYILRVINDQKFLSHNDNAIYDLTIDNALKINDGIEIQDDVYYFSICGDDTHYSSLTGTEQPNADMLILLKPFGQMMGGYYNKYTAGGFYIDKSWLPNDGMVNVVSGLYPFDSNQQCLKANGSKGYVMYDGYSKKNFEPGIWNVLPPHPYDHLSAVGGMLSNTTSNVRRLYLDLIDNVVSTYKAVPATSLTCPFVDVAKSLWSYDYINQMFQLGVVNGRDGKTFAPDDDITRAEFVKMIACLDGVDVSGIGSCRFKDVAADDFFAPYIEWAAQNGIVLGYSADEFGPYDTISREQMATIVCRYAEYAGIMLKDSVSAADFTDASCISDYAAGCVKALQKAGVICGMLNDDGTFCYAPQEPATRDQACKILSLI